ncbi:Uncharacterized protein TCM_011234 [Theobroma cacao]|uniref:Uncharacterized protein n=1 Tax=Theobroma cacao TaxID=3641 RepID=A0A061E9J6_THECC|nr:Uncharacterized protein TCM_011234 [Theobroma cacao]
MIFVAVEKEFGAWLGTQRLQTSSKHHNVLKFIIDTSTSPIDKMNDQNYHENLLKPGPDQPMDVNHQHFSNPDMSRNTFTIQSFLHHKEVDEKFHVVED